MDAEIKRRAVDKMLDQLTNFMTTYELARFLQCPVLVVYKKAGELGYLYMRRPSYPLTRGQAEAILNGFEIKGAAINNWLAKQEFDPVAHKKYDSAIMQEGRGAYRLPELEASKAPVYEEDSDDDDRPDDESFGPGEEITWEDLVDPHKTPWASEQNRELARVFVANLRSAQIVKDQAERAKRDSIATALLCNMATPIIEALHELAKTKKDERVSRHLRSIADEAFQALLELARTGDSEASDEVCQFAIEAVKSLNQAAGEKGSAIPKTALRLVSWIAIVHANPSQHENPSAFASKIGLGKGLGLVTGPQARWDLAEDWTRIALSLRDHICEVRGNPNRYSEVAYSSDAAQLPEFKTGDAAHRWWKVAESAFLDSYPEPERVTRLNQLIKGDVVRKYPSRIQNKILARLKQRLLALAP